MKNTNNLNSVRFYDNAETQKAVIFKENRGKSGVYRWTNKVNGKSYIGSSANLQRRLSQHYSLKNLKTQLKNGKSILSKALLKHGYSKFSLEILEYCDPLSVIKREQHYLDIYQPYYNILKIAGSPLGRKHTEETKTKIR